MTSQPELVSTSPPLAPCGGGRLDRSGDDFFYAIENAALKNKIARLERSIDDINRLARAQARTNHDLSVLLGMYR